MNQSGPLSIAKLRVESFGCLRDVTVDFGPLTVLVGPNDSGKSMLLRALATIGEASRLPGGWRKVFPEAQSLIAHTFNGEGDAIRFGLEGTVGADSFAYGVKVDASPGYTWVQSERLEMASREIERAG